MERDVSLDRHESRVIAEMMDARRRITLLALKFHRGEARRGLFFPLSWKGAERERGSETGDAKWKWKSRSKANGRTRRVVEADVDVEAGLATTLREIERIDR